MRLCCSLGSVRGRTGSWPPGGIRVSSSWQSVQLGMTAGAGWAFLRYCGFNRPGSNTPGASLRGRTTETPCLQPTLNSERRNNRNQPPTKSLAVEPFSRVSMENYAEWIRFKRSDSCLCKYAASYIFTWNIHFRVLHNIMFSIWIYLKFSPAVMPWLGLKTSTKFPDQTSLINQQKENNRTTLSNDLEKCLCQEWLPPWYRIQSRMQGLNEKWAIN